MKFIRFGICLLLAFAVLAYGTVEVWSESVLEIGAALLFLFWAILVFLNRDIEIAWNPLSWPLLGFIAIGLGQWGLHGTVYPYLTERELLRLAACFLLFFLSTQVFRDRASLRTLVWFLLFFGFVVGVFAIAQYFTFNGKIYWFRQLTAGGSPFGPYVNRNHFAGFMELIVPLGLSMLVLRGVGREQAPFVGLLTAVAVGSLLLSASRGGIACFVCELGLLALLVWLRGSGKVRVGAAALALLVAGVLVTWLGVGEVAARFAELRPGEISASRRVVMLKDTWHIFLDHPWKGTGLGTLVAVYPQYESLYDGKVVEHSHNDYVEVLADMGILGGICGLAFLVILLRGSLSRLGVSQSSFSQALHIGALVACVGFLIHSFVDFNLHIPSNALLFLLQAYLATSPPLIDEITHRLHQAPGRISVVDSRSRSGS
jgi:O-antigen ligase